MNPLRETLLVFAHEMRRSLRSAKTLVLLILYALATAAFGLLFVAGTRSLQEQLNQVSGGQQLPPEALMEMKMGGLSLFFGKDETQLAYLASIPLVVVVFAKVTLFFLPLLTALVGFDQVSSELQTRSIRYLSLRVRRGALLAGKVLAQLALLVGLTLIINLGVFAYAALSIEGFPVGAGLLALARFWALTLVAALAYVGLATLCSTLFRTPIFALLTALSILFGLWVLALLTNFESLAFLRYALPSHYEAGFFRPDLLGVLGSVGAFAGFAAAFLGLAWLTLRARDL